MDLVSSELQRNRSGIPPESTYTEDRHIEEEYRTAGLSISEVALTVLRRAVYSRLIPNSNSLFPPFRLNLVRLQSEFESLCNWISCSLESAGVLMGLLFSFGFAELHDYWILKFCTGVAFKMKLDILCSAESVDYISPARKVSATF